jgi:hypothetical protein
MKMMILVRRLAELVMIIKQKRQPLAAEGLK